MSAAENDRPQDLNSLNPFSRRIAQEIAGDYWVQELMRRHLAGEEVGRKVEEYIDVAYAPGFKGLSDKTVQIGLAECCALLIERTMEEGKNGGQA